MGGELGKPLAGRLPQIILPPQSVFQRRMHGRLCQAQLRHPDAVGRLGRRAGVPEIDSSMT